MPKCGLSRVALLSSLSFRHVDALERRVAKLEIADYSHTEEVDERGEATVHIGLRRTTSLGQLKSTTVARFAASRSLLSHGLHVARQYSQDRRLLGRRHHRHEHWQGYRKDALYATSWGG